MWIRTTAALALTISLVNSSYAQSRRARDSATAGGVAGAIIGGIIGHQNDETPEGALIGGAVGALAGGLLGRAQEEELQRQRYYQQQAYYQQQQQYYAQQQAIANSGISVADVINMARSGLSESLIVNQLHTKGVQRRLEVSEIISLHQQGVSDHIITAVQQAPLANQLSAGRTVAAAPVARQTVVSQPRVVVQEPVIYSTPVVVERFCPTYPVHRHYYPHYPRSGHSFRVGF